MLFQAKRTNDKLRPNGMAILVKGSEETACTKLANGYGVSLFGHKRGKLTEEEEGAKQRVDHED